MSAPDLADRLERAARDLESRLSRMEALEEGVRCGKVVRLRPSESRNPRADLASLRRDDSAGGR